MASLNDKINDLQSQLQSATKRKLKNAKVENSLRSLERSLTEDISLIQSECDFILHQMEDLKDQISKVTNQISITKICSVSEKSKFENHLSNINAHKQGYEDMLAKERKIADLQNKKVKEEQEEIERRKIAKVLEMNEQKCKEAAAIESECDAIERECSVLTKRNKAIMLQLKRKLVQAGGTRRELIEKNELVNN
ncbi:uncharacterized protein LOC123875837 [Maniola jurtina]|uniref:uncharacterized protein LOC123875837 n=1 Tax=Maniola jurtina TaxID=191418 RepID=UPI001E68D3A1|nr:uncharacterized protein LOC123875837 [Maniola jurtina]